MAIHPDEMRPAARFWPLPPAGPAGTGQEGLPRVRPAARLPVDRCETAARDGLPRVTGFGAA